MTDANLAAFLEELTAELMNASTGRLDVRVPVRGDETGPLADAVNHALGSFRGLVLEVRGSSEQLLQRSQRARDGAANVGGAVAEVAQHLVSAHAASQEMLASAQRSHSSVQQCSDVAGRSLEIVREAGTNSQKASEGLDDMRAGMQETSKRIKRLGESCQEIGEVIRLIDDVADQTNVLAVNAAIQSSVAGEAGEGFAIIVEEIRRLSDRARAATREMETLVLAIQTDSGEAVKAAERVTTGVVSASEASARSSGALAKVEQVAERLASAIDGIGGTMEKQGQRAEKVTRDLSVTEKGLGSMQVDCQTVNDALEQIAEVADSIFRIQEPFQVIEDDDSPRPVAPTTTSGTIVLKPGQMKGAASRRRA
jgi:twitching motility protein PilJ